MKRKALMCAALAACMVLSGCEAIGKELSIVPDLLRGKTEITANNTLNGNTVKLFRKAIENGNIVWIKEIAANNPGLDVNYVDDQPSIRCACWESNANSKVKVVKALIELGADPDNGHQLQLTTFNSRGYLSQVMLENADIDLEWRDTTDSGYIDMVLESQHDNGTGVDRYLQIKYLLDAGIKPYIELFKDTPTDKEANDPYYIDLPISRSNAPAAKLLMEKYLELNPDSGLPAGLEYAYLGKIAELADELEAHPELYTDEQENKMMTYLSCYWGTPEQYERVSAVTGEVSEYPYHNILITGNLEMLEYMAERDEIDWTETDHLTGYEDFLSIAAVWKHADICKWLIEHNIYVHDWDSGFPCLQYAAKSGDTEVLDIIYNYCNELYGVTEHELGIDLTGSFPDDPEQAKVVAGYFFDKGYDLRFVGLNGLDGETAEYLYQHGRPLHPTDLPISLRINDPELVKTVLDNGADPNQPDITYISRMDEPQNGEAYNYGQYISEHSGKTNAVIFAAVSYSDPEIIELLLNYGADIEIKTVGSSEFSNGQTPLLWCVESSGAALKKLIDNGADRNVTVEQMLGEDHIVRKKGPYSAEQFFEFHGRSDLAQIIREYDGQ